MPLGANPYELVRAYEGQVANVNGFRSIVGTFESFVNAFDGYLPFGRLVIRDTVDPTKVNLPAAGETIIGVAPLNDRFEALTDDPRVTGYPNDETVPVLNEGTVYMIAETAVTRGGALFVRVADSAAPTSLTAIGRVRNDADTGTAEALPVGTFRVLEDAVAGAIVPIKFSFPKTL